MIKNLQYETTGLKEHIYYMLKADRPFLKTIMAERPRTLK